MTFKKKSIENLQRVLELSKGIEKLYKSEPEIKKLREKVTEIIKNLTEDNHDYIKIFYKIGTSMSEVKYLSERSLRAIEWANHEAEKNNELAAIEWLTLLLTVGLLIYKRY